MKTDNEQLKNWILPIPINKDEIGDFNLNDTIQKVLIRRGMNLNDELDEYINPSELPNPEDHFKQLSKATQRILEVRQQLELFQDPQ